MKSYGWTLCTEIMPEAGKKSLFVTGINAEMRGGYAPSG